MPAMERPPEQPTDLVVFVQKQNEQLNRQVEELTERIKELTHLLAMEKQNKQIEQGTHPAPATDHPTNTNYLLYVVLFLLLLILLFLINQSGFFD